MDVKVEGHPGLIRRNGVIINTDKAAFLEFVSRRDKEQQRNDQVAQLSNEVSDLKELVNKLMGALNATEQNKG